MICQPLKNLLNHVTRGQQNEADTLLKNNMNVQEYCRLDRSFDPTPIFEDITLPQVLTFSTFNIGEKNPWFPPTGFPPSSGLGFDFALWRGNKMSEGAMGTIFAYCTLINSAH